MTVPLRSLARAISSMSAPEPPDPLNAVKWDYLVILAALLCALAFALCLISRYWLGRHRGTAAPIGFLPPHPHAHPQPHPRPIDKGLKKKILHALPRATFNAALDRKLLDCAICLTEFVDGRDEIRVLPQCGHGFHVNCIDMWLCSHSSCPSCRRMVVTAKPRKCGCQPATRVSVAETDNESEREVASNTR